MHKNYYKQYSNRGDQQGSLCKMMSVNKLLEVLKYFIIHSKYFPDSDWLTAHV